MSDADPSRKRRRTDENATTPQSQTILRRGDSLYYPDGNIILMAFIPPHTPADLYTSISSSDEPGDTTCDTSFAIIYKVHTGVLASQCGFFSTLFRESQAAFDDASDKLDGVPFMELTGDDWQSVDDFLKAMYLTHYLSYPIDSLSQRAGNDWIALLDRVLTLAKKYEAERIHAIAVNFVKPHWPTTVWLWEKDREARTQRLDPARAVRIGTNHAVPSILPVAFYELHMAQGPTLPGDTCYPKPDLTLLSAVDLRRLIDGGVAFDAPCRTMFSTLEETDTKSHCQRPKKGRDLCADDRIEVFNSSRTIDTVSFERRTRRPFLFLRYLEEAAEKTFCFTCRREFQRRVRAAKLGLWRDIPKAFDLVDVVGENWGAEDNS